MEKYVPCWCHYVEYGIALYDPVRALLYGMFHVNIETLFHYSLELG